MAMPLWPGWVGAGGAVLFVLVLVVEGWTRPGYSPTRHPVSALALGRRGWIQTANFLVSGAAITVGAIGLGTGGHHLLLAGVVTVFGLALVASGAFRMDPLRGYPPGTPDGDPPIVSRQHRWHDAAGAVVFLALPAAAAVSVFVIPGLIWTAVSAVFALGLLLASWAFGVAWERDAPRTGLVQRAYIIPGWFWLAALFLYAATT